MCKISPKVFVGLRLKLYHQSVLVEEAPAMWPLFVRLPALGEVVRSDGFQTGRLSGVQIDGQGLVEVLHVGARGNMSDGQRTKADYVVMGVATMHQHSRTIEYQYLARRLDSNGHYNPDGELITFILCAMPDSIRYGHFNLEKHDIRIVGKLT